MAKTFIPSRTNQNIEQTFHRLMYKGSEHQVAGRWQESIEPFTRGQRIFPQHPEPLYRLALTHYNLGNHELALDLIDRALALVGDNSEYLANRAAILSGLGRYEDSVASSRRALAINPLQKEAYNNLAMALVECDQLAQAEQALKQYIELEGDTAVANFNMGVLLQNTGRHEASRPYYEHSLELEPDGLHTTPSMINIGNAHKEMGRYRLAMDYVDQALKRDSHSADAWNLKGGILKEMGKPNASLDCFNIAAELDQKRSRLFVYNRGMSELLIGRMPQGWLSYENRWEVIPMAEAWQKYLPWQGEDLTDKILFVHREQGLGDTIQFMRYIPIIKQLFPTCRIHLACEAGLEPIFSRWSSIDTIFPWGDKDYKMDITWNYHIPLMSIPWVFKTTRETIPANVPYITANPELQPLWRSRRVDDKINVGLVWSGGYRKDQPKMWTTNNRRNCEWSHFERMITSVVAQRSDIVFHSLQKGNPAESDFRQFLSDNPGFPIFNYMDDVKNWDDTAAYIDSLDLVIAVDTSTLHMAGAMGKPVWLLNRMDTCWRWFLRGDTSPWYPSMQIFRQKRPVDWTPVVAEITQALLDMPAP